MNWQPIETMPRDAPCLVYGLDCDGRGGYWKSYGLRSFDPYENRWTCLKVAYPSHWMPLPEPPDDVP